MAKQLDLNRYIEAVKLVKGMCEKTIPIKQVQFLKDHKLSSYFFPTLVSIGAIREEIGYKREGTIFSWQHKPASNETESFLPNRVCECITERSREIHREYNKPDNVKKRVINRWKAGQRNPPTKNIRPEQVQLEPEIETPIETLIETPQPTNEDKIKHTLLSLQLNGSLTKEELIEKLKVLVNEAPITSFKLEVVY